MSEATTASVWMQTGECELRRPEYVAWVALAAAFLLARWLRFSEPLGLDQGLFVYFGDWVLRGELPYRDIWDSKPPAIFYTYALSNGLVDPRVGLQLLEALTSGASLALVVRIARYLSGAVAGIAAGLGYLAIFHAPALEGFWSTGQAERFLELPVLGAIALLISPAHEVTRQRCRIAGGLMGVAILYKLVAAPLVLVTVGLLAWRAGSRREIAEHVLCAAVVAGAPLALLAVLGSGAEMWEALVVYKAAYAQAMRDVPSFALVSLRSLAAFGFAIPAVALLALAGWMNWLVRREPVALALAAWPALALAIVWLQGQFSGYHFAIAQAPLAIAAGCGAAEVVRLGREGRARRWVAVAFGAAVVVGVSISLPGYARFYAADLRYSVGQLDREEYWRHFDRGSVSYATDIDVGAYLRDRTLPNDRIVVWGLAPGVYAQSGRRAATRYVFHHLLLTEAPLSLAYPGLDDRRRDFLAGLETQRPAYFLVGRDDANGFEPLDSREQLARFEALRNYVAAHYREETTIGHFVILRRTADSL